MHGEAGLSAREDRERWFRRCRGPVRLVQACLCAVKRTDNTVLTSDEVL